MKGVKAPGDLTVGCWRSLSALAFDEALILDQPLEASPHFGVCDRRKASTLGPNLKPASLTKFSFVMYDMISDDGNGW